MRQLRRTQSRRAPSSPSKLVGNNWGPFYLHGLSLIPVWISNHMPCKVWDEITYPFPNFNGCILLHYIWVTNTFNVAGYAYCTIGRYVVAPYIRPHIRRVKSNVDINYLLFPIHDLCKCWDRPDLHWNPAQNTNDYNFCFNWMKGIDLLYQFFFIDDRSLFGNIEALISVTKVWIFVIEHYTHRGDL